jgi:cobaltochelatase CobS
MPANMYDGTCRACGLTVKAGEGVLLMSQPYHSACTIWDNAQGRRVARMPSMPTGTTPEPESPAAEPTEDELKQTAEALIAKISEGFLATVPAMVRAEVVNASRSIEIKVGNMPKVKLDGTHKSYEDVMRCCVAGVWPMLVGPAGSGKTTLASQIAKTMKRKFYSEARVTSEYKLLGFMDAMGKYVRTQFREAYEKGGVFLLDEMDASDADALVSFNQALDNGVCPFPDKLVTMHKDFIAIAACNTFGRGADRQYVGRNQLDAATLDRFATIFVDYDEMVENALAGNSDWAAYVQKVRAAVAEEKVRHIVSPRASRNGAKLLAGGMDRQAVEESCIWKGLDDAQKGRVLSRMGAMA